jgi:hypothetical protein
MRFCKHGFQWFLAVMLAVLLTACGGSGSGGSPGIGPALVNLGLAGNYAVFANTGISNATTGFALTVHPSGVYSTSAQVTGKVFAFDYAPPTPTNVTTASNDMGTAYTDAAGRLNPTTLNLGAGTIGGLTLAPGLHRWESDVTLPFGTNLTLSGGPNDRWIMQITGTLTTGAATSVFLTGGARAKNIFWQVAGSVTFGANATFEGVVLAQTAINLGNQALANSRLLAQSAVNLDQNTVSHP